MGLDETLDLPLKRFWFLVNQVDRLRAEQDMRQIQILASVQDSEAYQKAHESLKKELGTVYVWEQSTQDTEFKVDEKTGLDPEFDRAGLHALKGKGRLTG